MMLDMLMEMAEVEKKNLAVPSCPSAGVGAAGEPSRGAQAPSLRSSSPSPRPSHPVEPSASPRLVIDILGSETEGNTVAALPSPSHGLAEAQGESVGVSSKRPIVSDFSPPAKRSCSEFPCLFAVQDPTASVDSVLLQLARGQSSADAAYLRGLPHSSKHAQLALCLAQASSIMASGFGNEDASAQCQINRELSDQLARVRAESERTSARLHALMTKNGAVVKQCEDLSEKLADAMAKYNEIRSVMEGRLARACEEQDQALGRLEVLARESRVEMEQRLTEERNKSLGETLSTAEGLAVLDQYRTLLIDRYPHTKLFLSQACPIGMHYVKETIRACEILSREQGVSVDFPPTLVLSKMRRELPLWKGNPQELIGDPWWEPLTRQLLASFGPSIAGGSTRAPAPASLVAASQAPLGVPAALAAQEVPSGLTSLPALSAPVGPSASAAAPDPRASSAQC